MSELINTGRGRGNFRRYLLASVSMAAFMASATVFADDDAGRPTVWIELGGQLERLNDSQETFTPPFMASITQPSLLSALNVQKPPAYAISEEGKISFQPEGSDWIFSGSVRYGRSQATRQRHQQTVNAVVPLNISGSGYNYHKYYYPSRFLKFADGKTKQSENHAVLDFQAGKDFGLGMFGRGSSSVLSAGIRFAQFGSKTTVNLSANPDLQYPATAITSVSGFVNHKYAAVHFHHDAAMAEIQRSFHGIGPSLSWNASVPFMGNADRAQMAFDWGANGALLFGRQKVKGHHQTTVKTYNLTGWNRRADGNGYYGKAIPGVFGTTEIPQPLHHTNAPPAFTRMRTVTVPNLGGFAGVSLKWPNAKLSVGYRADFFFGAMDGGIDTAKKENRGFYGPFATISVGIGG